MSYEEKLSAYEALADGYFETARFAEYRANELSWLDEGMWDFVQTPEFDSVIVGVVRDKFPPHEHEHFISHYREILRYWVASNAKA
jgi:hypothetical protein